MLTGKLRWLPLAFCLLCVTAHGQEMKLEPGTPGEREIAAEQRPVEVRALDAERDDPAAAGHHVGLRQVVVLRRAPRAPVRAPW